MKKQRKYPAYQDLALLPKVIAETVVEQSSLKLERVQVEDFAQLCDARCLQAYEARAKWMMTCVDSDRPDHLYRWIRHWLEAYIKNPDSMRQGLDPANPM